MKALKISCLTLFCLSTAFLVFAQELYVTEWLKAGSIELSTPLFYDQKNVQGKVFEDSDYLKMQYLDIKKLWPEEGQEFHWSDDLRLEWIKSPVNNKKQIIPIKTYNSNSLVYLATYVELSEFGSVKFIVKSTAMFEAWLNGECIIKKYAKDRDADKEYTSSKDLKKGKYLMIIKAFYPQRYKGDWSISACINRKKEDSSVGFTLDPERRIQIEDYLFSEKCSAIGLSFDGKYYHISYRKQNMDKTVHRTEIRRSRDDFLMREYWGDEQKQIHWMPSGNAYSYKNKNSLYLVDLESNTLRELDLNTPFGSYYWAPDGSYIIYTKTEKPKDKTPEIKKIEYLEDRWASYSSRSFLYRYEMTGGTHRRLTYGKYSTQMADMHPDGKSILCMTIVPDYEKSMYRKHTLIALDMNTMQADTLFQSHLSFSARYCKKGNYIIFTGGPELFGDIGKNISEGKMANNYDQQLYLMQVKSKKVLALTRDFDPSVQDIISVADGDRFVFKAVDRDRNLLFLYDLTDTNIQKIITKNDVVESFSVSKNMEYLMYSSSGVSSPSEVYLNDIQNGKERRIAFPGEDVFRHIQLGKVQDWNYRKDESRTICGRVYYPPDFDNKKKYPLIVYYYGGTYPTNRAFGGRYPKNLWAAHDYVVYVLQPDGAIGFGQEFSAGHVNNWGKSSAVDIIEASQSFIQNHSFIDKNRVGCIGASYGGFMTMYLLTQTDMFSAAVSHAGISSLSGYWGEGNWGYLYSAVATAGKFPWSDKDFYVEQSPLFLASRINTALLLIHGDSDDNVPPGESEQMFTALKLLGKNVDYLKVKNQGHHITSTKERIVWTQSIIAYFDKHLKKKSAWWESLYPQPEY
jgi:dipeptidyl aminopeptidase/acylaminoacyl peptidase